MDNYLDKEYHKLKIDSSITESEKTQSIQNYLLVCILEKLEGDKKNDKTGIDGEIVKITKGRK